MLQYVTYKNGLKSKLQIPCFPTLCDAHPLSSPAGLPALDGRALTQCCACYWKLRPLAQAIDLLHPRTTSTSNDVSNLPCFWGSIQTPNLTRTLSHKFNSERDRFSHGRSSMKISHQCVIREHQLPPSCYLSVDK